MKFRTHVLFAALIMLIVIFGAWPVIARAQELTPLVKGEQVQGSMWVCMERADAVDVAEKEIADGMPAAIALFRTKEKCVNGYSMYTPVKVVATLKNKTTTTYVIEVEVEGMTFYLLSKVGVSDAPRTSI